MKQAESAEIVIEADSSEVLMVAAAAAAPGIRGYRSRAAIVYTGRLYLTDCNLIHVQLL